MTQPSAVPACDHDHAVQLYESEPRLARQVAIHLADALDADGVGVIVATAEHRALFADSLSQLAIDPDRLVQSRRLMLLDARQMLRRFMRHGGLDTGAFRRTIDLALGSLAPGHGPVHIYGEMVALLWGDGDVPAALALEDLWNDYLSARACRLLCAYPISSFENSLSRDALTRLRNQHRTIITDRHPETPEEDDVRPIRPAQRDLPSVHEGHAARLADLLCAQDHPACVGLVDRLVAAGNSPAAIISRVITPAMHIVGERWANGELTVSEEHLATAACERLLVGLYPSLLSHRPRTRERVLVAAPTGERHALAPRAVSDVLEGLGYDVILLGVDVPAESVAQAIVTYEPDVLALSLTQAAATPTLGAVITAARRVRPDLPILLGGQGVPASWADLGCTICISLEELPQQIEAITADLPVLTAQADTRRARGKLLAKEPTTEAERFARLTIEIGELARREVRRAHENDFLAYEDVLTGLPNRRAFEQALERAARRDQAITLLLLDIDRFKRVNDTHGHDAGDIVLRTVATGIIDHLRGEDFAARIGGDEFAVLLNDDGSSGLDAKAVGERIRDSLRSLLRHTNTTVSIGGAAIRDFGPRGAATADRALYEAKKRGGDQVIFHDPARLRPSAAGAHDAGDEEL